MSPLAQRFQTWSATRKGRIILIIAAVLVALRIALPYIMLYYANRELGELKGYRGRIEDLSVALLRGAYTLDSIYINKLDDGTGQESPFFRSREVDLSIEWKSLFRGKLAGEIIFDRPYLKFTENKVELDDVARDSSDFRELLKDFMPIQINRCEVRDGHIIYADYSPEPDILLEATDVDALAQNLRNTYQKEELLPATLQASASVHGGSADLNMRLNPLASQTDFDMDLEIKKAQLPQLNPYFKDKVNVDVNKGTFNMYMESAAKDGKFVGYVKPFIEDLDVLQWKSQDKEDHFFRKVWEGIVGLGGKVLENKKHDNVATKIPLEGRLGQGIDSNSAAALTYLVRNAFFEALKPTFDYEISIRTAFFGKKSDSDKGDSKKEKKRKEKKRDRKDKKKV
ncbi:MAG TPA: DUF748 domain-containing protein [Saprospiraceae bacterium]|nr:DUF748 domain-containing protein [Saprospiraceae bacterium]HND87096.1 DUF748 domain-containing protein [Saprospiraceae bacterium]HNG89478.1 DUF748 domain-containing protein [Saprospiraceae bacterium]